MMLILNLSAGSPTNARLPAAIDDSLHCALLKSQWTRETSEALCGKEGGAQVDLSSYEISRSPHHDEKIAPWGLAGLKPATNHEDAYKTENINTGAALLGLIMISDHPPSQGA